jgi:hypothetical protein
MGARNVRQPRNPLAVQQAVLQAHLLIFGMPRPTVALRSRRRDLFPLRF